MSGNWIKAVALMMCLGAGIGATGTARAEPDQAMTKLFEAQQRIAEKGEPDALFHLAEMHEQGLGTPKDMNKARDAYAKAAEKGHAGAKAKLARWDQIAEEQRIAEQNRAREREEARAAEQERARQAAAAKAAAERERAAEAAKAKEAAKQSQRAYKEQTEADAAKQKAAKAAEQKRAAESAKTAPASGAGDQKPAAAQAAGQSEDDKSFTTNPCKGPTARFLSTCQ